MSSRNTLLTLILFGVSAAGLSAQEPKSNASDKIRKALEQELKVDFNGTLEEVVAHLQEKTKIRFHVDNVALNLINFQNPNELHVQFRGEGKVRQLLQRLLTPYSLTYAQVEDTLYISTEELAFQRQLRQRVPIDVNQVPLEAALLDLSRKTGVKIVVDPRRAKDASTPVTLQLDDATVETCLRLLTEIGGLKSVRVGNVMFITNEERADRLRKEEPQPNNPMQGVQMPALNGLFQGAFGGIGGGFGGAALPAIAPANPAPAQKEAPAAPKEP